MNTTWKELQETCLRKMFSLDGRELVRDSSTNPYLHSMPSAANEAMRILATTGRYWKKCLTIRQGDEDATDMEEASSLAEETQDVSAKAKFQLGAYNAYDLAELTGDFYSMREVMLSNGGNYGKCEYRMEGDELLLLPAGMEGEFRIWYHAYPPKITAETADDFEIGLPPEVASMIALYMAGQLYKDDDISIAQIYMNEFMTWLEELKASAARANSRNAGNGGSWTSVKGYY